jgi:hypothetical protein
VTARRSRSSWICSEPSAAPSSSWCPGTWPARSPRRSPSAAPTRRSAWTRFTSSRWRPTRWMRSGARSENEARKDNNKQLAKDLKGARFALCKNAENLTGRQQLKARPDPEDQPAPVPRLPALPTAAPDLPRRSRQRDRPPKRLAEVGIAMSPTTVRQARAHDPRPARRDRGRDSPRALQRPRQADQHPDRADHPPRPWLPLTTSRHRTRNAAPRRPLPTPTRPLKRPTEPAVGSD